MQEVRCCEHQASALQFLFISIVIITLFLGKSKSFYKIMANRKTSKNPLLKRDHPMKISVEWEIVCTYSHRDINCKIFIFENKKEFGFSQYQPQLQI